MFALKVVWICLFLSVVLCDEMSISNLRPLLKPAVSGCQEQSNIELDQLKTLSISQPLSHDQSCFVECVLRKFDLIQNDQFSIDKANSYVDRFMKHGEELINDVKKEIVNGCAKESQSITDTCDLSGAIFQCMGRELQKAGFIKEHTTSKQGDSPSDELIYEIFESI